MTLNGEILKTIFETLSEATIPIYEIAPRLSVGYQLDESQAKELAEEIFRRLVPFIAGGRTPDSMP